MQPHAEPHVHVHLELPKSAYEKLKKLHPGYGEVSNVMRRLVVSYVASKTK